MRKHDFSDDVIHKIGQAAMFFCQNAACNRLTGYSTSDGKCRRIAEAAHVLPSGTAGPRAQTIPSFPHLELSGVENGIWLCRICHKMIDDDPAAYPATLLFEWKEKHGQLMRRIVGKDIEAALLSLGNSKRYYQEANELLSFFDNRRVLFEEMDGEFPARVLDSLDMIRQRLNETRARTGPDSELFSVIGSVQTRIHSFLRNIGPQTDLTNLRCDSGDPTWVNFYEELRFLRTDVIVMLRMLAGSTNYQLKNI
ncbi:HNH endonuclease [Microcoleus sp. N9_A3]|uniref:HNH endonuclease n=1 Tax=Microcoleus sp. N9_A3 TaxID=3055382 RepID=UPI002FD60B51